MIARDKYNTARVRETARVKDCTRRSRLWVISEATADPNLPLGLIGSGEDRRRAARSFQRRLNIETPGRTSPEDTTTIGLVRPDGQRAARDARTTSQKAPVDVVGAWLDHLSHGPAALPRHRAVRDA